MGNKKKVKSINKNMSVTLNDPSTYTWEVLQVNRGETLTKDTTNWVFAMKVSGFLTATGIYLNTGTSEVDNRVKNVALTLQHNLTSASNPWKMQLTKASETVTNADFGTLYHDAASSKSVITSGAFAGQVKDFQIVLPSSGLKLSASTYLLFTLYGSHLLGEVDDTFRATGLWNFGQRDATGLVMSSTETFTRQVAVSSDIQAILNDLSTLILDQFKTYYINPDHPVYVPGLVQGISSYSPEIFLAGLDGKAECVCPMDEQNAWRFCNCQGFKECSQGCQLYGGGAPKWWHKTPPTPSCKASVFSSDFGGKCFNECNYKCIPNSGYVFLDDTSKYIQNFYVTDSGKLTIYLVHINNLLSNFSTATDNPSFTIDNATRTLMNTTAQQFHYTFTMTLRLAMTARINVSVNDSPTPGITDQAGDLHLGVALQVVMVASFQKKTDGLYLEQVTIIQSTPTVTTVNGSGGIFTILDWFDFFRDKVQSALTNQEVLQPAQMTQIVQEALKNTLPLKVNDTWASVLETPPETPNVVSQMVMFPEHLTKVPTTADSRIQVAGVDQAWDRSASCGNWDDVFKMYQSRATHLTPYSGLACWMSLPPINDFESDLRHYRSQLKRDIAGVKDPVNGHYIMYPAQPMTWDNLHRNQERGRHYPVVPPYSRYVYKTAIHTDHDHPANVYKTALATGTDTSEDHRPTIVWILVAVILSVVALSLVWQVKRTRRPLLTSQLPRGKNVG